MVETLAVILVYAIPVTIIGLLAVKFLPPKEKSFIYKDGGVYKITDKGQTTVSSHSDWK